LAFDAIFQRAGDDERGQKADVFGDEGDEKLQDEALCPVARDAAEDEVAKDVREDVGRLARDGNAVIAEDGLDAVREEESERVGIVSQVADGEAFNGIEKLGVEVVNPEIVEVAEDDVRRPLGDNVRP
jgi:hypothetical protein